MAAFHFNPQQATSIRQSAVAGMGNSHDVLLCMDDLAEAHRRLAHVEHLLRDLAPHFAAVRGVLNDLNRMGKDAKAA